MKKVVCSMLSLLLLIAFMLPNFSHAAAAESSIQLTLNGKRLYPEVAPRKIGAFSYVPVRIISEELGAKVSWDQAAYKVTIEKDTTKIQLVINKTTATVNGKTVDLEKDDNGKAAASVLIAGNTLVPVRFVAENLGVQVDWDDATQTVSLLKKAEGPAPSPGSPIVVPDPSPTPKPGTTPTPTPTPPVNPTPTPDTNPNKYPEIRSISTTNEQVVIQASGAVEAKVFILSAPDRLVVDLPASAFSTQVPKPLPNQSGEIASTHPLITKIRYAYNDPATSTIRVVMDLTSRSGYRVIENGATGKVTIEVKQSKNVVVIDAGHGGTDPGAISVTSKKEKDFTLSVALKVQKLLSQVPNVDVYMTRADDTYPTLDGRVAYANNLGANVFVSIHGNNFSATSRGTETYYFRSESLPFAKIMHKHLVAATGFLDRGVKQEDFRVVKYTTMPAVLLEVGYLSNKSEEAQMYNNDFQNRVAQSVVDGIKEYLKIK